MANPLRDEDLHYMDFIKLQYERIAHHENQRLTFSSLVMALTTALLPVLFVVDNKPGTAVIIYVCALLIIINWIAIKFVSKSREWVKLHQGRARYILNKYNPDLARNIYNDEGTAPPSDPAEQRPPLKRDSDKDTSRRPSLQIYLHAFLIGAVVIFLFIKLT
ncbi:hypothetical protein SMY46_000561 [Cronobacter turicensis]|uniref:hypothetical protein n=1 Tax=Cronobacter turicensis TaxID=413502 RepID=UPI0011ACCFAE|nr:hypothetical protein [Cronobacter turicensis]EKY3117842.1 hypothetical protein [Cronobacter turicensis]ELU8453163.1 hypothetical protein [Cronobacter turicensis]ELY4108936.1 hypothetical protein [Cronobacter turicensis]ELY4214338.1 hypothetical protein [Cronobacter turicensis]EMA1789979.1 hypothetical protein [Cronobacter turicensis]